MENKEFASSLFDYLACQNASFRNSFPLFSVIFFKISIPSKSGRWVVTRCLLIIRAQRRASSRVLVQAIVEKYFVCLLKLPLVAIVVSSGFSSDNINCESTVKFRSRNSIMPIRKWALGGLGSPVRTGSGNNFLSSLRGVYAYSDL